MSKKSNLEKSIDEKKELLTQELIKVQAEMKFRSVTSEIIEAKIKLLNELLEV